MSRSSAPFAVAILEEEAGAADVAGLEDTLHLLEGHLAANANLRPFLEGQINELLKQIGAARGGGRIDYWEKKLAACPTLAQLLDPDSSERHRAVFETNQGCRAWDQRDWEANRDIIAHQTFDLLAEELAVARVNSISAEKLGLAEVAYPGLEAWSPPEPLLGTLPSSAAASRLSGCWPDFLAALLDTLRIDGAITLGSQEKNEGVEIAGFSLGRYVAREAEGYLMRRFIGERRDQRRRQFTANVLSQAGIDDVKKADDLALDVLGAAFDQLLQESRAGRAPWLESDPQRQAESGQPVPAFRLKFSQLALRKPRALFQCSVTGHVWSRSVLGCAPEDGCAGTLDQTTPDKLDQHPRLKRLRQEYRTSDIFRMAVWAEEHSAQLSPQENRRLQELFKKGIRNILSSTTTLEVGIDIGGLTAVLLGNAPPGRGQLPTASRASRPACRRLLRRCHLRPTPSVRSRGVQRLWHLSGATAPQAAAFTCNASGLPAAT